MYNITGGSVAVELKNNTIEENSKLPDNFGISGVYLYKKSVATVALGHPTLQSIVRTQVCAREYGSYLGHTGQSMPITAV